MDETDAPKLPFDRSYWVVPGKLLAGAYPGNRDAEKAQAKLSRLLDAGIRNVIDLTEPGEANCEGKPFVPYEGLLLGLARERGSQVRYLRMPIADTSVPTQRQMLRILDAVDRSLHSGHPVYVHCWGGVGRTGTVVGCWLARHGIASGKAVLEKIRELRRGEPSSYRTSPESEAQRAMVVSWRED